MNRWAGFVVLALLGGSSLFAAELPIETFFRNYDYADARLSPDGRCLAALASCGTHMGLVVVDLEKNKATWIYKAMHVEWFEWANTNRLIFGYTRLVVGLGTYSGIIFAQVTMTATKDGGRYTTLPLRGNFLATLPGDSDEVLVNSYKGAHENQDTLLLFPNVDRLNLVSGALTSVVKNPGKVTHWISDHNGVIRAGIAKEEKTFKVLYRADEKAPWTTIGEFKWNESFIPEGFEADNRTMIVKAEGDGDTEALYTYDLTAKKFKDLGFRHAEVDVDRVIFTRHQHRLVGITYDTERPEVMWFDKDYRRMQASVDHALTNTVNILKNTTRDGTKALFLATSDRLPGTYYLVDMASLKLQKLFDVAEWIHPEEMAEMKPIEYKSRDGLTIHGYLTLPRNSSGKNLPIIVNPHGGPEVRDRWGFHRDVQFLANRGYAVLQMNFRGSSGYGKKFREAGWKQWGLKQQDDMTDGVQWAIAQGIADPKRIAIYGGSYGGFAALTGLEKTPELYRCGISMAGVTDITKIPLYDPFRPTLTISRLYAAERIGDLKNEKEQLKENSPITHIDKIQVPVLVGHGELDPIVPYRDGRSVAGELKKHGKLFDFISKGNEGHGFFIPANQIEFWKKAEELLKANMN